LAPEIDVSGFADLFKFRLRSATKSMQPMRLDAMAEKYDRSSGAKEVSGMTDAERPCACEVRERSLTYTNGFILDE